MRMAFTAAARRPLFHALPAAAGSHQRPSCRRRLLGACVMASSTGPSSTPTSSSSSSSQSPGGDEWSDGQRVLNFARQGPIFSKSLAIPGSEVALPDRGEWVDKGLFLRQHLGLSPTSALASDVGIRIFHLYLPVYFWLRWLLGRGGAQGRRPCRIIGINAPQGAGKTTLVNACRDLFRLDGFVSVVLSIDDFYLPFRAQQELGRQHAGNRLLEFRGNAGTHDVALGRETLLRCLQADEGDVVRVPAYDKSLYGGRGDRIPQERWPTVEGPIDVVLLEGWMLGFRPLPPDAPALAGNPDLKAVNALLGQYEAWHELVEAWVVVQVDDVEQVHAWRLEAERRMRERRGEKGSLSDEEVKDFVSRFLPAYRAFLAPSLFREEEGAAAAIDGKPTLRFSIDAKRRPKS